MDYELHLISDVTKNVAILGIGAYLATLFPVFRRALTQPHYRWQDQLFLILVFGLFSALGNYLSVPVMDSSANTRIVGAVAGGILGGPMVGMGAGFIGAFVRFFMGGFTMWPAVISNIIAGLLGGFVYHQYGQQRTDIKLALLTAFAAELVLKFLVLMMAKPFQAAWELEKIIAIPTIIANCAGVCLCVYIIQGVYKEQDRVQALAAQQGMRIIRQTTSILKHGLSEDIATKVVTIIYNELKVAAVAITDTQKVLAFIGSGSDHHRPGTPIVTAATKTAMTNLRTVITNTKEGVGCPQPDCPLTSVVDVPLIVNSILVGSIKVYKTNNESFTPYEVEITQGLADVFSLQLAQAKIDEQSRLLEMAEYQLLKAQINPHFLFNTLGTVMALCRTNPETARSLLKDFSDFFRKTLKRTREVVSLDEEMDIVRNYIRIEKARFGGRISIIEEIPASLLEMAVPIFSLQPIVENAVKHGLSPKRTGGMIRISAALKGQRIVVQIEDDGVGMDEARLAQFSGFESPASSSGGLGIGLYNIHNRLKRMYDSESGLFINSVPGVGTTVKMVLPTSKIGGESHDTTAGFSRR